MFQQLNLQSFLISKADPGRSDTATLVVGDNCGYGCRLPFWLIHENRGSFGPWASCWGGYTHYNERYASDAGLCKSASRRIKFPGCCCSSSASPTARPAYPKCHDPHLSTSNLHHQDMGMVAPAAFRGGGRERGDSLGSESLCEGDTRRGPGQY